MEILKGLLFLGILGLLVFVFKQMYQLEEIDSSQNSALLSEELTAKQFADSLRSIASFDTLKQADARLTAQIDDFDARIIYQGDTCVLEVKKSHRLIARRTWKYLRVSNLMCSDLNGNQDPEFWLYGLNKLNKIEFKAFEFSGVFVKVLYFPNLIFLSCMIRLGPRSLAHICLFSSHIWSVMYAPWPILPGSSPPLYSSQT